MHATLPHRLAAVWFADIVGYGRLSSSNEDEALHLVRLFQRSCREMVRHHGGRLVKFIGDAALAEFPSTEGAVRSACALEPAFRRLVEGSDLSAPQLHVGVHVGDVATGPDGDLYGEGVNMAARLQDLAGPGQVLVSEDVRRQLQRRPEFRIESVGERKIQDRDEPIPVYRVLTEAKAGEPVGLEAGVGAQLRALHQELVRRGVYRLAAIYVAGSALAVGAALGAIPRLGGTSWLVRLVALLAVLGLPLVVLLTWTFEIGQGGIRRHGQTLEEPGAVPQARTAYVALVVLAAAIAGAISFVGLPGGADATPLAANRLAVLYFEDFTAEGSLGYLVDGLTEGLIHELSGVPGLEVVSRNGVKPFQGADVSVDSVARALRAGTLVQGSVAQSGDRFRVTVQLIDGTSGTVLESETLERSRGELFALQDDLAQQVADFLRRRLGEEIRLAEMRAGTESVVAWELVQRAEQLREEAEPLVKAGALEEAGRIYDRADSLLVRARAADSAWVQPVVQRGWIAHERSRWSEGSDVETFLRWNGTSLEHAREALRIEPDDPSALELRGTVRLWRALFAPERDPERAEAQLEEAEQDLRAAVEANPGQAGAWYKLTVPLAARGELREAKLAAERAIEADAYLREADEILWRLFAMSYDLNQPAEAEQWCGEGRQRFPEDAYFVQCQIWLMTLPGVPADPSRAWALMEEHERLVPPDVLRKKWNQTAVAAVLARAGLRDSAIAVAVRARADERVDPARALMNVEAFVRTLAGREAEAVGFLAAYLSASPGQRGEVAKTWWFESLHDRADFQALVGARDSVLMP